MDTSRYDDFNNSSFNLLDDHHEKRTVLLKSSEKPTIKSVIDNCKKKLICLNFRRFTSILSIYQNFIKNFLKS